MKEVWKDIKGFKGLYQVSDFGRVRSLDRIIKYKDGRKRMYEGRVLKLTVASGGYLGVSLSKHSIKITMLIHRLVLETFVSPCPKNKQTCHNDGDYFNNKLTNLRWGTGKENMADKKLHGTHLEGYNVITSKLTEKEVKKIRKLRKSNITYEKIADLFNVSRTTVTRVVKYESWKHI